MAAWFKAGYIGKQELAELNFGGSEEELTDCMDKVAGHLIALPDLQLEEAAAVLDSA